jgi:hypothetical protein
VPPFGKIAHKNMFRQQGRIFLLSAYAFIG